MQTACERDYDVISYARANAVEGTFAENGDAEVPWLGAEESATPDGPAAWDQAAV